MRTKIARLLLCVFIFSYIVSAAAGGAAFADGVAPADSGAGDASSAPSVPSAPAAESSSAASGQSAAAPAAQSTADTSAAPAAQSTADTSAAPAAQSIDEAAAYASSSRPLRSTSHSTSGEGTLDDPESATTTTTTTNVDKSTGNTTTSVDTLKEWKGTDDSIGESVSGAEESIDDETRDKNGKLISANGTVDGDQTTTDETITTNGNGDTIIIENGTGTTSDGKVIKSDVPTLDVTLKPGSDGKGDEEHASAKASTWFDEDSLNLPDWVRQKDGDDNVAWATDGSSEDNGTITNITVTTGTKDEKGETATNYVRTVTSPDGSRTTQTVRCVRDENGHVVAYNVETVEVESVANDGATPPDASSAGGTSTGKANSVTSFELPEKPDATVIDYYADGSVKNGEVVLELCDSSGRVIGYSVATMLEGVPVSYSKPILGQYVSTTTTEEYLGNGLKKLTTTKTYTTHTNMTAEGGSVEDGERSLVGWMDDVVKDSSSKGELTSTFVPGIENNHNNTVDTDRDLYNRYRETIEYKINSNQLIQNLGELSLESAIRVKGPDGNSGQAHIFVVQDANGHKFYAYCCDYSVSVQTGAEYNVSRLEDADYYDHNSDDGRVENQIRAIVRNGYWGVTNDSGADAPTPGSLDAFKKLLVDNGVLTQGEADKITDGMALTATQAAIWYYGNSGEKSLSAEEIVGDYGGYDEKGNYKAGTVPDEKKDIVNRIYRYLINASNDPDPAKGLPGEEPTADNNIMTPDDFAQSLKLAVGAREDEGENEGKYHTMITFSMAQISDKTKNDLVVYVKEGESSVGYRLCGDSSEDAAKNILAATKNDDGSYTLKDVLLSGGENVELELNLVGTQIIENGVILFKCDAGVNKAQTFIGGGRYEKDVDYSVKFGFNVTDPAVTFLSSAKNSASERLDWVSEYHTTEIIRNADIPKTGDALYVAEVILAVGAALSLACAAMFIARARKTEN